MKIKSIKFIEVDRFVQQYQRPYNIDVAASIEGRGELDVSNFTEKLPTLAGKVMSLGPGKPAEIEGGWDIRRHVFVMTLIVAETQKLVRELIVSGYVNDLMNTNSIEHTDDSLINPKAVMYLSNLLLVSHEKNERAPGISYVMRSNVVLRVPSPHSWYVRPVDIAELNNNIRSLSWMDGLEFDKITFVSRGPTPVLQTSIINNPVGYLKRLVEAYVISENNPFDDEELETRHINPALLHEPFLRSFEFPQEMLTTEGFIDEAKLEYGDFIKHLDSDSAHLEIVSLDDDLPTALGDVMDDGPHSTLAKKTANYISGLLSNHCVEEFELFIGAPIDEVPRASCEYTQFMFRLVEHEGESDFSFQDSVDNILLPSLNIDPNFDTEIYVTGTTFVEVTVTVRIDSETKKYRIPLFADGIIGPSIVDDTTMARQLTADTFEFVQSISENFNGDWDEQ